MKLIAVAALGLLFTLPVMGDPPAGPAGKEGGEASHSARVLFTQALKDVPGKQLVAVALELEPRGTRAPTPHRHPGSVYVYVTRGTARLALDGGPVREVRAGESFFEPPGALHTVAESASNTESAAAIAVMIVPAGAPLVTAEPAHQE